MSPDRVSCPDLPFPSLAVVAAVEKEVDELLRALDAPREGYVGRRRVFYGSLQGVHLLILLCGMGMVNAAQATTALLERHPRVSLVISLGTAGSYPSSGLDVGDVAVATEEIYGDLGLRKRGRWSTLEPLGIPLGRSPEGRPLFHRLPLPAAPRRWIQEVLRGGSFRAGPFVTVARVSASPWRAQALEKRWGKILAENMEGAAVVQVCLHYGVPVLEMRGISNPAGCRPPRPQDLNRGALRAQETLMEAISDTASLLGHISEDDERWERNPS